MSAGLFGLLDDIAALARMAAASLDDVAAGAAKASAKAAGVVVDDTAVTPQYVHGVTADREVPIIKRIAKGSIRNKLLFILPAALLLSQILPWALTVLLMCGGVYLCYEGAHKLWGAIRGHGEHAPPSGVQGPDAESAVVLGAVRTDFILSAEIMVISLHEVADEPLLTRAGIMVMVALAMTVLVYGVVALIVKMDDAGLALAQRDSAFSQRLGRGLVKAMPALLDVISVVGVAAMIWVGGHILLGGLDELGWHWPYELVHHFEHWAHDLVDGAVGSVLGWCANTLGSAALGLVAGFVTLAVVGVVQRLLPGGGAPHGPAQDGPAQDSGSH
ncbi:MAG: DUF808 domain-containing protein [Nocardioidaceae bacterium]